MARTEASNAASAVSTTTRVWLELALRPRRIGLLVGSAYFTGAAGAVTVGPIGAVLADAALGA